MEDLIAQKRLIQVLHGEYSDTRELAVVQLVLMGARAIPPLEAYLEKENSMQQEVNEFSRINNHTENELYWKTSKAFKDKWGEAPSNYIACDSSLKKRRARDNRGV